MLFSRRAVLASAATGLLVEHTAAKASAAKDAAAKEGPDSTGAYAVADQNVSHQTRRLKLSRGKRRIASLLFSTDYPTHFRLKPELHAVCTPAGMPVTASGEYCFIHHQSIMCGHGKVHVEDGPGRLDFYRQLPFPDPGRSDPFHKDFDLFQLGPSGMQRIVDARWSADDGIQLDLQLDWHTRELGKERGPTIAREQRRYRVVQRKNLTIVDQITRLAAAERPIVLQADRHSFHGVRIHDLIDVEDGGTMTDSEGRTNPSGNYTKLEGQTRAPRWVDCTGVIAGQTVGVAVMAHPENLRNEWYMREFGLIEVSPTLEHDQRVTQEKPLVFATRFIAHDGPWSQAAAETLYEDFAASPRDTL